MHADGRIRGGKPGVGFDDCLFSEFVPSEVLDADMVQSAAVCGRL